MNCLMMDDRFAEGTCLYGSYEDMYNDVKNQLSEKNISNEEIEEELDTIEYILLKHFELDYYRYDYDLRDYFVN